MCSFDFEPVVHIRSTQKNNILKIISHGLCYYIAVNGKFGSIDWRKLFPKFKNVLILRIGRVWKFFWQWLEANSHSHRQQMKKKWVFWEFGPVNSENDFFVSTLRSALIFFGVFHFPKLIICSLSFWEWEQNLAFLFASSFTFTSIAAPSMGMRTAHTDSFLLIPFHVPIPKRFKICEKI